MTQNLSFKVRGMSCRHCKMSVEKSVGALPGVKEAVADVAAGQVTVAGEALDPVKILSAIEELGYIVEK